MDVRSKINHLSGTRKELVIETSAEVVQQEFDKTYAAMRRHAKVAGYRPGKVPLSVIREKFRPEARETVANHLIREALQAALDEHRLRIISEPNVRELSLQEGHPLKFKATIEVLPRLETVSYEGLRVTKKVKAVTEADIDKALEEKREQYAELVPVERAAETGDFVTIKLTGTSLSADSENRIDEQMLDLEIGSEDLLPAFTENLKGMPVGETRRFRVAYPPDYHAAEMAGQEFEYEATLEALRVKEVPPLDEEFVRTISSTVTTLAELRQEIRREIEQRYEREADAELQTTVLDRLIERNPLELPDLLVRRQLETRLRNVAHAAAQQGIDPETADIDWSEVARHQREKAVRDLQAAFILQRIADLEQVTISDAAVDAEIAEIAARREESPLQLKRRLTKEDSLDSIKDEMRNRKALEMVVGMAEVAREMVQQEAE